MFHRYVPAVALLITAFGLSSTANAQLTRVELERFLDVGWKPSIANYDHVQREYAQLILAAPGNARLEQAYFLLLLRQRKYDEALIQSTKTLKLIPDDPALLRARIWTFMLTKNYAAALVEMETLAAALSKPTPKLPADEAREAANFLGRIYAYLDGPVEAETKRQTRESVRAKIVEQLGNEQAIAFREGIVLTAEKYAGLQQDLKQTKAQTISVETAKKEQLKVDLAAEKLTLGDQEAALAEEFQKIKTDAQSRIDKLDGKLAPLTAQLAQLQSKANQWQIDVSAEDANIATWSITADNAPNQFEYDRAMAQVRFHQAARNNALNGLAAVQNQGTGVLATVNQLQSQRQGVVNQYNADSGAVDRRLREIAGRKNRIVGDERKADQPSTGFSTGTSSLAGKTYGFATYEDFPFEQERKRLIESLK